ncbi:MAG: phosphonate ABC transporter ATP-binding protein [Verrucomicrobiota bacterium]
MDPAFEIDTATRAFAKLHAVDAVSLTIQSGEQVAFIGPSGSGKTTLLRLLNAQLAPTSGRVSALGEPLAGLGVKPLRQLRSRIATIPQHLGLVESLTAVQNIVLGRGGQRGAWRSLRDLLFTSRDDLATIHELLDRVGIEEKLFTRVARLSGGQRQRVAIARALFQNPEAILADEPVSAVDPARARDTVQLLTELSSELGFTLVVSLHHLELAREFFPRLVGLRAGRVVFDGKPEQIDEADLSELYQLSDEEMMRDA